VGGGLGIPPLLGLAKQYGIADAFLGYRGQPFLHDEFVNPKIYIDSDIKFDFEGYDVIYSCGPKPMLKALAEYAESKSILCYVSMEERMACGIGACLVCACAVGGKYLRCCKDGPVFDAREVDWNE
jgi:dihydroorotate dehydrogenase electron transfer subunit